MTITMLNGLGCGCQDAGAPMLSGYGKVINFNTAPVINTYVYDRDGYWNCNDWMTWHQKLVEAFMQGRFASKIKYSPADALKKANEVFMIWWNKQSWYNYATDQCMLLNQTFRKYFNNTAKLNLDAVYSAAATPFDVATNLIDAGGDVVENIAAVVENVSESAKNTSGVLKWLLPTLLVGIVVAGGFYVHKNYIKGDDKIRMPRPSLSGVKRKSRKVTKRKKA